MARRLFPADAGPWARGVIIGGTAAMGYSLLLGLPFVGVLLWNGDTASALAILFIALLVGVVVGLVPAMVIGGYTSELIVARIARLPQITKPGVALIWARVCLGMLLLISLVFWGFAALIGGAGAFTSGGPLFFYSLFVLGPAKVYLACGAGIAIQAARAERTRRGVATVQSAAP